jgi:hypothetical protein
MLRTSEAGMSSRRSSIGWSGPSSSGKSITVRVLQSDVYGVTVHGYDDRLVGTKQL